MANTLGMRAMSLGASAFMLGMSVLAALSVTYTIQRAVIADPPGIPIVYEAPPPPPPAAPDAPPRVEAPSTIASLTPLPQSETPPTSTTLPTWVAPFGPVVIDDPRWERRPHDLARYFPRRALERGVQGEVVLDCLVSTQGALNCAIVSETPLNWGLGGAALRISRDHVMVPAMRDGRAVEGRYRMRVPFRVDAG
jgi:protein TonB